MSYFVCKSSHQRCSMKKGILRNFTKFTGKHLCQSLFFHKLYQKRGSGTGVFLWNLLNFKEHLFYRTPLDDYFYVWSVYSRTWTVTTQKMKCSVKHLFTKEIFNGKLHFWNRVSMGIAINYFRNYLHLRCLAGFWIRLWSVYNNSEIRRRFLTISQSISISIFTSNLYPIF